jgi:hypothetical protein
MGAYRIPEKAFVPQLRCIALAAFSLTLYLALFGSSINAATIAWGPPTNISGDSDVSTNGTLLGAVNPGLYGSIAQATTVNGVNFIAWAPNGGAVVTDPSGLFTLTPAPGFAVFTTSGLGSASAPFSALSSAYRVLLDGADYASNPSQTQFNGSITMTINGLADGKTYEFQWWFNDSRPFSTGPLMASTGVTSVLLDPNTTDSAGGLGQHIIGTFVADAATQDILFSTTGNAVGHSGFQLRVLTAISGDYNDDHVVDARDYVLWRKFHIHGAWGYTDWKTHFGETSGGSGSAFAPAVPEPTLFSLLAIATAFSMFGPLRRLRAERAQMLHGCRQLVS